MWQLCCKKVLTNLSLKGINRNFRPSLVKIESESGPKQNKNTHTKGQTEAERKRNEASISDLYHLYILLSHFHMFPPTLLHHYRGKSMHETAALRLGLIFFFATNPKQLLSQTSRMARKLCPYNGGKRN